MMPQRRRARAELPLHLDLLQQAGQLGELTRFAHMRHHQQKLICAVTRQHFLALQQGLHAYLTQFLVSINLIGKGISQDFLVS